MRTNIINPRLEKSRSKIWEIRYTERGETRSFTRTVTTRTDDRRKAESFFTAWLEETERLEQFIDTPTVNDLCVSYLEFLESYRGDAATQKIGVRQIQKDLGHLYPQDLTAKRLMEHRRRRKVALSTARREAGILRAVLNYGVKHKAITADLIPHVELPRQGEARTTYLNDVEERKFHALALADSNGKARLTRLSRFVALALDTGARREAVISLKWSQVDLVGGVIDFRTPGKEKTNKRRSVTPISDRLLPILQRAYDERKTEYVLDTPGSIRRCWTTFIKKNGFEFLHIHDLRRTFISLLIQAGVDVLTVANLVNDSPEIILRHYAHLAPNAGRAAINVRAS